MSASYLGNLPYTDENQERVENAEHLQIGTIGTKRVTLYDSSGNEVSIGSAASSTAAVTSVNDTNVSTTLLASNSSRKGAVIFNDSSAVLYVKFGTTASSSDFSYKVNPFQTLEIGANFLYTGRIDGIWASDSTGAARITELT